MDFFLEFFYPEQADIPKFRFHRHLDDHSWYELEGLELVVGRKGRASIGDLIGKLSLNDNPCPL